MTITMIGLDLAKNVFQVPTLANNHHRWLTFTYSFSQLMGQQISNPAKEVMIHPVLGLNRRIH